jgi:ribosomal-protein-alanine N-acetyltransferase
MEILRTERLVLRQFRKDDAPFIIELVNDPAWLRYIGDKNIRSLPDAIHYLETGPQAMYARYGFSLYAVELKGAGKRIGMCGLIKRESLADVDLGFAFLPAYRSLGYAYEATAATLQYAKASVGLSRIVAITSPDNAPSIKLLERLGFRFETLIRLAPDAPDAKLFATDL